MATGLIALVAVGCVTYDHDADVGERDAAAQDDGAPAADGAAMDGARDDGAPDAGMDADASAEAAMDAAPDGADAMDATADDVADDATDAQGGDASSETGPDAAGCTGHVVVNEVEPYGASGDGNDEFVELYNASSCDVVLASWTVRSVNATDATAGTVWTGTAADVLPAGRYFVLGGAAYTGAVGAHFSSPAPGSATSVLATGAVGLFGPDGARVDSVRYGTAAGTLLLEGSPLVTGPTAGQSLARVPNGRDTDANAVDFRLGALSPGAANP